MCPFSRVRLVLLGLAVLAAAILGGRAVYAAVEVGSAVSQPGSAEAAP
jgi:hypothetical protein